MTSLQKVIRLSFNAGKVSGMDMKWVTRSRNLLLQTIISRRRLASATDRSDCPSTTARERHHLHVYSLIVKLQSHFMNTQSM